MSRTTVEIFPNKRSRGSWIVQTRDGIGRSFKSRKEAEQFVAALKFGLGE